MIVRDLMTGDAQTCRPETDLAAVGAMMWDRDCGFLPVVDATGTVVGAITDRDICMAVTTRRELPERIAASQVMSSPVRACMATDTVAGALKVMKEFRVRRLPVIDSSGRIVGVVTMNDMILAAGTSKEIPAREVVATLAAISAHRTTGSPLTNE
jgi:CBS domain-containing protein